LLFPATPKIIPVDFNYIQSTLMPSLAQAFSTGIKETLDNNSLREEIKFT